MNSLCPLYFKSTLNQRLIAVLCLKSYTKLCDLYSKLSSICVFFGNIPGIFTPMRKGPYGNFSKTEK